MPPIELREKPPLGLRPRIFWLHERRDEILQAIDRYMDAGKEIPVEWVQEYNDLTKEVSK